MNFCFRDSSGICWSIAVPTRLSGHVETHLFHKGWNIKADVRLNNNGIAPYPWLNQSYFTHLNPASVLLFTFSSYFYWNQQPLFQIILKVKKNVIKIICVIAFIYLHLYIYLYICSAKESDCLWLTLTRQLFLNCLCLTEQPSKKKLIEYRIYSCVKVDLTF